MTYFKCITESRSKVIKYSMESNGGILFHFFENSLEAGTAPKSIIASVRCSFVREFTIHTIITTFYLTNEIK